MGVSAASGAWWQRHGWTVVVLSAAFSIAFLIRTLWVAPLFQQWGPSYLFAGGSDSFYHWRVSDYIILNHRNLGFDPLLKFPFGAINPREPLFDWMNALLGLLLAPFFGGNPEAAGRFSLELAAPLWAALGVFPVYLIGKEVSSRRMGLVAAMVYPFLVANIDSSTFGYANYLSFYTFFILIMLYGYLRTVRAAGSRRWVESYRHPKSLWPALRGFWTTERTAVKWAVFTGVSFGAVILTWQGYTFVVAAVLVFLVVTMIIERIRRVDSFGLYVTTGIVGLVGFPMAFPYYFAQGDYHIWFAEPLLIYFGALLILLPFLFLRDAPWVISVPVLVMTSAAAVGAIALAAPATFADILSGQGYFVKTLIYTTVAEAQAPSIDSLILGYGVVTFFLAFFGLAFVVYRIARERFQRRHLLFLVIGIISIYLPISAAKFFYIGSAAFALLPAEALVRLLDVGGYPALRRNVASLSDRRSQLSALRRSFKARHVLILALVVVIVLPNVWYSIDAGIPYNSKSAFNGQIFDSLPAPLRTSPVNASNYYLGAAGTQLDTPNQYDEAGYDWLAGQDVNLPPPQRPAFISWWDYGFQSVSEGGHPSVADNFQNGIDPAGNFLLAQNESLAIGVLTTTLLTAEAANTGRPYLPNGLNEVLASDDVALPELHTLLVNTSADVGMVLAHPERYLPVDPNHLDAQNAMYDTVSYFLATTLNPTQVAQVYDDVQAYTGWSIRYAMVDSRLIPFSGQSTGIFYAPVDLTDRIIGAGGEPTTYFQVSVVGSDGNTYPAGQTPAGVVPISYPITYEPPFYRSMIYHIYFGYNASDAGQSGTFPGSTQASGNDNVEPGWMLAHFRVVYRTAYYCPQPAAVQGASCFSAMNLPDAVEQAKLHNGTAETAVSPYYQGGEAMLEYYPGQPMTGQVTLPNGRPVPDVRVTVYDSWGIPHMTTVTSSDGAYSLLLPPGADTLNVSTGSLNPLSQAGSTHLATLNVTVPDALGLSLDAPTMVRPIILSPSTVEGFVYWTSHNGSAYNPLTDPLADGAQVTLSGLNLTTLSTTTDASGAFVFSNVPPSVYQVAIRIHGSNFSAAQVTALPGKTVNETTGLSLGQVLGTVTDPRGTPIAGATVSVTGLSGTVGTNSTNASGKFRIDELGVGNYTVQASVPTLGLLSQPVRAALSKEGANATVELRLAETVPVSVTVTQNGQPVGAIPVRFTLIVPPGANPNTGNNSSAQASVESQEKANTSVVLTGPGGFAETDLPAGNYSVYALGYNGSTPYAAFWSGSLAPGASTVPTLALRPAQELSGKVTVTTAAPLTAPIEVAAYDPSGHVAWAFTNTTQHWALWLPSGPYTIVASSNAPFQSTILTLDVTGPTDLSFNLSLGILAKVSVHSSASSAPIANAQVALNLVPQGAQLTAPTDASGVAAFLLPGLVPPGASFCVNASATGYGSASACGLSPGAVANHSVVLSPSPVPVSVAVSGVPSGTPVQVNLTSTCSCAPSKTLSGLAPFNIALAPANYSVTAWAPNYPGGLERPPAPINWSVPIGATGLRFNVPLLHQVLARGTLSTPSGVPIPNVEVQLSSSAMSEAVRGGAFVNGFLVAPGTYQYFASAAGARPSTGWVAFGSLNVNGSGGVSPTIDVNGAAVPVSGTVHLPNGAVLSQGFTATFVTASGFPLRIDGTAGTFATELPVNGTFAEFLNMTSSLLVHNTSVLYQLALPTHAVCTTRTASAICDLALIGQPASVGFSGQLSALTSPSGIAGHLLFVGPQPSTNRTEASSSSDGRFSLSLPPGDYDLYANAASGGFALNERITIGQANETNVSLVLLKAWTATLTVLPPSGEIVGGANVTFQAFGAPPVVFPMTAGSGPYSLALPPESYVVNVSAPSDPFGVPTNATAGVTLPMSNGNAAATLKLSDDLLRTASLSFTLGDVPANITLPPSGGVVSLGFVVHNTGNAPESLVLSASPSTWNYTLRPSHVDLGVLGGSATASGTLIVRVPAGTPVAHPLLVLTAELNGTSKVAGHSVLPPPIAILPAPGVELGPSPTVEPIVSTSSVTVALFVRNTGNVAETVSIAVVDGSRLATLGWSTTVKSAGSEVTHPLRLDAAGNDSISITLNATRGLAQPPGSVTVEATAGNLSSAAPTSTAVVPIPIAQVSINGSQLSVSGPGIGPTPTYPDWLVPLLSFVPALALLAGLASYRWYRTRKWVR